MLEPLVDERALNNFWVAADVIVATGYDAYHRLPLERLSQILERRDGERACGLRNNAVALVEGNHRLAHAAFGNEE